METMNQVCECEVPDDCWRKKLGLGPDPSSCRVASIIDKVLREEVANGNLELFDIDPEGRPVYRRVKKTVQAERLSELKRDAENVRLLAEAEERAQERNGE